MKEIRKFRWLHVIETYRYRLFHSFLRTFTNLPSPFIDLKAEENFIFLRAEEKEEGKDSVYLHR